MLLFLVQAHLPQLSPPPASHGVVWMMPCLKGQRNSRRQKREDKDKKDKRETETNTMRDSERQGNNRRNKKMALKRTVGFKYTSEI